MTAKETEDKPVIDDQPVKCPKCGAELLNAGNCQTTINGTLTVAQVKRYVCGSKGKWAWLGDEFEQSQICATLAQQAAALAAKDREISGLRTNGACPACHERMEGIGYLHAGYDPDPEVVFQCKCGRHWMSSPPLRRAEYMATVQVQE